MEFDNFLKLCLKCALNQNSEQWASTQIITFLFLINRVDFNMASYVAARC